MINKYGLDLSTIFSGKYHQVGIPCPNSTFVRQETDCCTLFRVRRVNIAVRFISVFVAELTILYSFSVILRALLLIWWRMSNKTSF